MPDPQFNPGMMYDPEDYLKAQRAQMVSEALGRFALTPSDPQNSGRQTSRVSPLSMLARVLAGKMTGNAIDRSLQSQTGMYQHLMHAQQDALGAPATTGGSPGFFASDEYGGGQAPTPGHVDPNDRYRHALDQSYTGVPKEITQAYLDSTAPTPEQKNAEYGTGGNTGLAQALVGGAAHKAATEAFRGGAPVMDYSKGTMSMMPDASLGAQYSRNADGTFSASAIPGAAAVAGGQAYGTALGTAAGKPEMVPGTRQPIPTYPGLPMWQKFQQEQQAALGGPQRGAQPAAPASSGTARSGPTPAGTPKNWITLDPPKTNEIMTPGRQEATKALAQQAVGEFQKLNDRGEAAIAGLRYTGEMKNLLQGFNPGKLAQVGSVIGNIATTVLHMDPQTVNKTLGDPGSVEAFSKNTAALAQQVVKEMTNRVSQMEFKTFLENNPNALMTPSGLKRVIDYMEKGFNSTIEKQKMASEFWQHNQSTPERFVTAFPAYYNQQHAEDIKAGKLESADPAFSGIQTRNDVQSQRPSANEPHLQAGDKAGYGQIPSGSYYWVSGVRYRKGGS